MMKAATPGLPLPRCPPRPLLGAGTARLHARQAHQARGRCPRRAHPWASAGDGGRPHPRRRRPTPTSYVLRGGGGGGAGGWGNANKLSPPGQAGPTGFYDDSSGSVDPAHGEGAAPPNSAGARRLRRRWQRLHDALEDVRGRVMYSYFNWRQDTWSDLQLFLLFNAGLLALGAWIEGSVVRQVDSTAPRTAGGPGDAPQWWGDLYAVVSWVLGQDLPQLGESGWPSQVFAAMTLGVGLASFALVLALIEQVVLEVLESNVRRGSQVYEQGHIVVLAWCESASEISQLTRILGQICHANKGSGGSVVVVLAQDREKLEMEGIFRDALPPPQRLGTSLVFRQGSPLDPAALHQVAATRAKAVIICGDSARSTLDSDAQCLRAAVLLDELVDAESPGATTPTIVMQVCNSYSMQAVDYAASGRVVAVPAFQIQARRLARIIRSPIVSVISNMLTDFRSGAHIAIHEYPQLVGLPFRALHFHFPYAIVHGIMNESKGSCKLNPSPDRLLRPGDKLVLIRPGPAGDACPAAIPLHPADVPAVDPGDWSPASYTLASQDEAPLGVDMASMDSPPPRRLASYVLDNEASHPYSDVDESDGEGAEQPVLRTQPRRGVFVLPLQYNSTLVPETELLICGWGRTAFMRTLLQELDHGPQALPRGACVTLLNDHNLPAIGAPDGARGCENYGVRNLKLRHIKADPRNMQHLRQRIDIPMYKSAIVLADILWSSRGSAATSGPSRGLTQSEMLRMDAAVLLVQLNLRALLEEHNLPDINIVVQRQTMVGNTRFEDAQRLPLGLPVNRESFIGKVLAQTAIDPAYLRPYLELGIQSDLVVQDSSAFAAEGEELSFLQLQARALAVHQIALGYFRVPSRGDQPLEVVVNPQGLRARSEMAVWNRGDGRCKLVTLASLKTVRSARPGSHSGTDSSDGGHSRGGSSGSGSDHSSDMDEARSAGAAVAEAAAPGQTAEGGSPVRW